MRDTSQRTNTRRDTLKWGATLGGAGLVGALSGCTSPGDGGDGDGDPGPNTLQIGISQEINSLDPRNIQQGRNLSWKFLLYNSLVRMQYNADEDAFEFVPDLAESYEWVQQDGENILQFVIRDGLEFHNGDAVTAELIKEELDYWKNPDTNSAQASRLSQVTQISVDNGSTLNLHFEAPFAPAHIYFSRYVTIANPNARAEEGADNFNTAPVGGGTGPYQFVSYTGGNQVELERYDNYHEEGLPQFENAVLNVLPEHSTRSSQLRAGDIHIDNYPTPETWLDYDENEGDGIDTGSRPAPTYPTAAINHEVAPLDNKQVRQALSMATDRESLVETVYRGLAQSVSVPHLPGSWWHWPDAEAGTTYDVEGAQSLLEEAGYGDGFEMEMQASTSKYRTIAQILKSMWSEVGVTVNIQTLSHSAMIGGALEGDYTMAIFEYASNPDPDYYFYHAVNSEGQWTGFTYGYENAEYDDLTLEARTVTDQAQRADIYQSVANLWAEEMPTIPLGVVENIAAWRENIQGYWVSNDSLAREAYRQVYWE